MRPVVFAVALGCSSPSADPTDLGGPPPVVSDSGSFPTPTDTDTGTPPPSSASCADDVVRLGFVLCVESTATVESPTTFGQVLQGSGRVTAVGAVDPIAGSVPIGAFPACDLSEGQRVRLVDDAGETWTFGWDIDGPVDDDSSASVLVGSTVDFHTAWAWTYGPTDFALLLADADGPLFLLERWDQLTEAERGFAFDPSSASCTVGPDPGWDYHSVTFVGAVGEVVLWPGQTSGLSLSTREVQVVLGDYSFVDPCPSDWCADRWWATWAR